MEAVRAVRVSEGSSAQQLQHEIKALSQDEREALLDSVFKDQPSITIPADQVLAMKADLSIT